MKKWILLVLTLIVISGNAACSNSTQPINDPVPKPTKEETKEESLGSPVKKKEEVIHKSRELLEGIVPVKLIIPVVRIHAIVEPVSVSDNGQMEVPRSTERVGYLSSGVLPGAIGNAIMDGHVDNYKGPAVFFQLKKLKKGDVVIVKNEKDCSIQFIVESVEIFKTTEAPLQKIFGTANEARLNLITCTGRYSRSKKEHEARLVVFTKRLTDSIECKQKNS
jgi:LPXTG-site transpeptidase (sortase) family protein